MGDEYELEALALAFIERDRYTEEQNDEENDD